MTDREALAEAMSLMVSLLENTLDDGEAADVAWARVVVERLKGRLDVLDESLGRTLTRLRSEAATQRELERRQVLADDIMAHLASGPVPQKVIVGEDVEVRLALWRLKCSGDVIITVDGMVHANLSA